MTKQPSTDFSILHSNTVGSDYMSPTQTCETFNIKGCCRLSGVSKKHLEEVVVMALVVAGAMNSQNCPALKLQQCYTLQCPNYQAATSKLHLSLLTQTTESRLSCKIGRSTALQVGSALSPILMRAFCTADLIFNQDTTPRCER